jgi:hypothetical protein
MMGYIASRGERTKAMQDKFVPVGKEVEPDDRNRLALGCVLPPRSESIRYNVFRNQAGQILLDPVKSVPAREAWVHENPKRIKSIQRGIAQIEAGRVVKRPLPVVED